MYMYVEGGRETEKARDKGREIKGSRGGGGREKKSNSKTICTATFLNGLQHITHIVIMVSN